MLTDFRFYLLWTLDVKSVLGCSHYVNSAYDGLEIQLQLQLNAASFIRVVASRVGDFLCSYKFIIQKYHRASGADTCLDQSNLKMG
jgi:hypothetical protein